MRVNLGRILARYGSGYGAIAASDATNCVNVNQACQAACPPYDKANPMNNIGCMNSCQNGFSACLTTSNVLKKAPVVVAKSDNTLAYALLGVGLLWVLSKNKGQ